jgi:predicted transposase/invertase (TIGR01784 family)
MNILKFKYFDDDNAIRMFKLYDPERGLDFKPAYMRVGYFELLKKNGVTGNAKYWQDYFLGNELSADAPEHIRRAAELIDYVNLSEEERDMIDYAQKYEDQRADEMETAIRKGLEAGLATGLAKGIEKGREEGIEKGREEGREEGKREDARRMKGDGMSSELISKYTGLSAEEIAEL